MNKSGTRSHTGTVSFSSRSLSSDTSKRSSWKIRNGKMVKRLKLCEVWRCVRSRRCWKHSVSNSKHLIFPKARKRTVMTPVFHQRCAITAPLALPVVSKVIERHVILDYSQCSLTAEPIIQQKTANRFFPEKVKTKSDWGKGGDIFLDL